MQRASAEAQEAWARGFLDRHADVQLLVLAHTHRAALVEVSEGRWYLNPGAWMIERRYAVLENGRPSLEQFG